MTDLSTHAAIAGRRPASMSPRLLTAPLAPWLCVLAAAVAGFAVGRALGGDAETFERPLLLLLRFMAAMKALGVVAAAGVMQWRATQPITTPRATAYLGALALMGLAPGLIWSLGGIAVGAVLFHAGLLAFLVLAWRDDGTPLARWRA